MIAQLTGKVSEIAGNYLILDVNGVGYKVESFAPFRLGSEGQLATIRIYTHVRETELRLFGFTNKAELEVFEKLLEVSGVGPKTAMQLVSNFSVGQLLQAVMLGDAKSLTIKGVGQKTLAKIVIELKGKLDSISLAQVSQAENLVAGGNNQLAAANSDLQEALFSLGYKPHDFAEVIKKIDAQLPLAEQLREALKLLRS